MFGAALAYMEETGSHAILIRRGGQTVVEKYFQGFTRGGLNRIASGTKTFCGLMLDHLVVDGWLKSYDDLVSDTLPELKIDLVKRYVTYRSLLAMTSGWSNSEVLVVQVGGTSGYKAALKIPCLASMAGKIQYGAPPLWVFGEAVQRLVKPRGYANVEDYLKRRILDPAGVTLGLVTPLFNNPDEMNTSAGVYMELREWSKLGEFLLTYPRIDKLLPPGPDYHAYGMNLWNTMDRTGRALEGTADPFKKIPGGGFMAAGAGKNRLIVFRDRKLVIAHFGPITGGEADEFAKWTDEGFIGHLWSEAD